MSGGAEVTDNLWGARWSKLATNCYINVTAGLSGLKTMGVRTLPSAIPLATSMAAEACQVACQCCWRVAVLTPPLSNVFLTGAGVIIHVGEERRVFSIKKQSDNGHRGSQYERREGCSALKQSGNSHHRSPM